MRNLWLSLPALAQDLLVLVGFLLPVLVIGAALTRGYAPGPVIRAMMWRFRWANAIFALLVAVSVGMGVGLLAQERGLRRGTAAAAEKFGLIVTAPGSEITMMMAAVYLQPSDVPLLDGALYNAVAGAEGVALAAPLAFGDSFQGAPIIGTTADFARHLSDGAIAGRLWQHADEAIAGALTGLAIGDSYVPSHGVGHGADHDAHGGASTTVVGVMERTGTPWDRAVLVPVESVWGVHGLANGHAPGRADQLGPPFDASYFPGTPAIVVHSEDLATNYALRSRFTRDNESMAFFPGAVLNRLYGLLGDVRQIMSLMAVVTQGLVALSILVGLFILMRLFQRQLALLRALGAPARFICAVIWTYATVLLAGGALAGLALGAGASLLFSRLLTERTGILISSPPGWAEIHAVAGFLGLASLLALLPAIAVLRRPVIEGLRN